MGQFETNILPPTLETLKKRQSDPRNKWFNERTAWIKMCSCGNIQKGSSNAYDPQPRLKNALFNGTFDNRFNYKKSTLWSTPAVSPLSGDGRPAAGIVDLSIEPKNSKGTVKEATINWKCWTLEDLNILERLYMTPGLTCSVEWGWSKNIVNDQPLGDQDLIDTAPQPNDKFTQKMYERIKSSNGHQGALQGMIVDFNWSVNDEGGFDCMTKLLGKGDFLNQLFLSKNTSNQQQSLEHKDTQGNQGLTNMEGSIAVAKNQILVNEPWKLAGKYYGIGADIDNDGDEGDKLMVDPGGYNPLRNFWVQYVTWGWIEDVLITSNLSYEPGATQGSITKYIDGPELGSWKNISPKMYSGGIKVVTEPQMNRENTKVRNYYDATGIKLESQDPLVCQLPLFKGENSEWNIPGQAREDAIGSSPQMESNMAFDVDTADGTTIDGGKSGYLRNLLVNLYWVDKIYQKHKSKGRTIDFVKDLLEGINDACGNIWNFDVITDDEHQCLRVVDTGVSNKMPDTPVFMFKPYTDGSMVRSIDISTNVSEKLKGSIMAGQAKANAAAGEGKSGGDDTSAYSYFGAGIQDASIKKVKNASAKEAVKQEDGGVEESDTKKPSQKLLESYWDLGGNRSSESVSGAKAAWRGYLDSLEPGKESGANAEPQTKELILPLNLSLEIDGIEGLAWGNSIGISYLPQRYKDRCKFRVTKVSQKIDASGWTTKVETQFMVKK